MKKTTYVQKFGGTSLGQWERLQMVADIIQNTFKQGADVYAVVSAMSGKTKAEGTTSQLIAAIDKAKAGEDYEPAIILIEEYHQRIIDNLEQKYRAATKAKIDKTLREVRNLLQAVQTLGDVPFALEDNIIAAGEKISGLIVNSLLQSMGLPSEYIDFSYLMPVMKRAADISFLELIVEKLAAVPELNKETQKLYIVPGYMGRYPGGILAAVGRGYSDVTGGLIACAAKADEYHIWKEIDGVMSADPSVVEKPIVLPYLTTDEAIELSSFGMQAVHAQAAQVMDKHHITIRIKNVLNPEFPGTVIDETIPSEDSMPVRAITSLKNMAIINIDSNKRTLGDEFVAGVFNLLKKHRIKTELISTSQSNISICISQKEVTDVLIGELKHWGEVVCFKNRAIISIVGSRMKHTLGIAGRTFTVLADSKVNIEMISQGATEISISTVIQEDNVISAVKSLHSHFIEGK